LRGCTSFKSYLFFLGTFLSLSVHPPELAVFFIFIIVWSNFYSHWSTFPFVAFKSLLFPFLPSDFWGTPSPSSPMTGPLLSSTIIPLILPCFPLTYSESIPFLPLSPFDASFLPVAVVALPPEPNLYIDARFPPPSPNKSPLFCLLPSFFFFVKERGSFFPCFVDFLRPLGLHPFPV